MSVSSKTRALLNLTGHKPADLAECLGTSVQGVRNKLSKDVFSVSDLLRICDYLETDIILRTKDGQTINLTLADAKPRPGQDDTDQQSEA